MSWLRRLPARLGHVLAVQADRAAPCVNTRPYRDGDGAGQGPRGRALQESRRVRFSGLPPRVIGRSAAWTVRPLGVERQECQCLFWLCRDTALHNAPYNGHTETALALVKAGADVHCKGSLG